MSLRSWFRGSASAGPSTPGSLSRSGTPQPPGTPSPEEQQEMDDMEDAMRSMALIMNDDPEGAEARLRARGPPSSSFHQLGLGVSIFMRSILGFEKDVMADASARIADCEVRAWADKVKAEKRAGVQPGRRFANGSEFVLVYAQALLMNAIVSVLHESLTDALKAFYKLRKAFTLLSAIAETEERMLKELGIEPQDGGFDAAFGGRVAAKDEDLVFVDADEKTESGAQTPATNDGHSTTGLEEKLSTLNIPSDTADSKPQAPSPAPPRASPNQSTTQLAPEGIFTHPVDVFVHSGLNMCLGSLLLILSLVPPAFSRLLSIIGFRGDRERGVRMLWSSAAHPNVNGAVAGLLLLGYYHGLLAFADVLPSERDVAELAGPGEVVGYPRERCEALLAVMRTRYPDSGIWRMEEARVLVGQKKLREAVRMLEESGDAKMKQITALTEFELAIDAMCLLEWAKMSKAFLRMLELNDWSHAVYYFGAGCAELELYRDAVRDLGGVAAIKGGLKGGGDGDADDEEEADWPTGKPDPDAVRRTELLAKARRHKTRAEELFRKAPTVAGRKRFMARQMPFEVWVVRKLAKWEARAAALGGGVDLADAIGPSPAAEMIYLWNGGKRMPLDVVDEALTIVEWERCTAGEDVVERIKEEVDEVAIQGVCHAALLRHRGGRDDEARAVLMGLVGYDRSTCKGGNRDDYILASATYEMAMLAWDDACLPKRWPASGDESAVEEFRRTRTEECGELLETVARWETYVLDARFGMRVQTGLDSVSWLRKKKGWVV